MKIETLKINDKYDFELWYDDFSHQFYDELWINDITFISNNRDYKSQGKFSDFDLDNYDNIGEFIDLDEYEVIPINSYIHGGIALSMKYDYPFNCPFDSGVFGLLVFKKGEFGIDNCGLESFINSWQCLLNGEVYGFSIIKKTACECCENVSYDVIDSCGGFYGYNDRNELLNSMIECIDLSNELLEKIKR